VAVDWFVYLAPAVPSPKPFDRAFHGGRERLTRSVFVDRTDNCCEPHVMHCERCRNACSAPIFVFFLREGAPFWSELLYPFANHKPTVTAKHFAARVVCYHRALAATGTTVSKHGNTFDHFFPQNFLAVFDSL